MYIRESLPCIIYEPNTNFEEALIIVTKVCSNESLLLGLLYRSPNSPEANNNHLNKLIDEICMNKFNQIMLVGDLNFPGIDWGAVTTTSKAEGKEFHFVEKLRSETIFWHST